MASSNVQQTVSFDAFCTAVNFAAQELEKIKNALNSDPQKGSSQFLATLNAVRDHEKRIADLQKACNASCLKRNCDTECCYAGTR